MTEHDQTRVSAATARRRRVGRATTLALLLAGLLAVSPAAVAKPDPHPLTTWSTYTLCDIDCTTSWTVSLRADASRPVFDVTSPSDPATTYTIRLVRFYEANSDTLEPYAGTEINLLAPMWRLSEPVVEPYRDGNALDFTYSTGPRRNRYSGIQFTVHVTPGGLFVKFDTTIRGYQWQSTDPTAALVLEAQVLVNGEPLGDDATRTFVFSHFDGDLVYDPPLI